MAVTLTLLSPLVRNYSASYYTQCLGTLYIELQIPISFTDPQIRMHIVPVASTVRLTPTESTSKLRHKYQGDLSILATNGDL